MSPCRQSQETFRPVSLTVFFSFQFFSFKVDNEFEEVATQLLKRTQAMLNKYRFLLLEDAMVNVYSQHSCLSGLPGRGAERGLRDFHT